MSIFLTLALAVFAFAIEIAVLRSGVTEFAAAKVVASKKAGVKLLKGKSPKKKASKKKTSSIKAKKDQIAPDLLQKAEGKTDEQGKNTDQAKPTPVQTQTAEEPSFYEGFKFLRDFKTLPQSKNGCGPAAVRMVIWYLTGKLLNEEQLTTLMRKNNIIGTRIFGDQIGLTPVAMTYALNKFLEPQKISATYQQIPDFNTRLNTIFQSVDEGLPVIALVETMTRGLHWVVVIGHDQVSERLLYANSGGPVGVRRLGSYGTGWFETIPYSEFQKTNALAYGPLKNPLERLVMKLGSMSGMAENLLITLNVQEVVEESFDK